MHKANRIQDFNESCDVAMQDGDTLFKTSRQLSTNRKGTSIGQSEVNIFNHVHSQYYDILNMVGGGYHTTYKMISKTFLKVEKGSSIQRFIGRKHVFKYA